MHASARPEREQRAGAAAWLRCMLVLGAITAEVALADARSGQFTVVDAGSELRGGIHYVNAQIHYQFSEQAIEAMDNGVAVTVSLRMEVRRERLMVDETVAAVRARYRIQSHSLSQRFVVRNLSTDETKTFPDLDAVGDALGEVKDFPLLDDAILDDGELYRARIRATLDIESLPTPLRLLAYVNRGWRLASEWKTWPLQR